MLYIIALNLALRMVLANKKTEKLDNWIIVASNLKIREINSFVHRIIRDLLAVKNVIQKGSIFAIYVLTY